MQTTITQGVEVLAFRAYLQPQHQLDQQDLQEVLDQAADQISSADRAKSSKCYHPVKLWSALVLVPK